MSLYDLHSQVVEKEQADKKCFLNILQSVSGAIPLKHFWGQQV